MSDCTAVGVVAVGRMIQEGIEVLKEREVNLVKSGVERSLVFSLEFV